MSTARYCTLHLSLSLSETRSLLINSSQLHKNSSRLSRRISFKIRSPPEAMRKTPALPKIWKKTKTKTKKSPNNKRKINSHRQQKQTLFRSSGVSDLAMASKSARKKKHKRPPKQTQILDPSTHLWEFQKNSSQEMGGWDAKVLRDKE